MKNFGDVEVLYCGGCDRTVPQILGGDDEWYCSVCSSYHFECIHFYYKKWRFVDDQKTFS